MGAIGEPMLDENSHPRTRGHRKGRVVTLEVARELRSRQPSTCVSRVAALPLALLQTSGQLCRAYDLQQWGAFPPLEMFNYESQKLPLSFMRSNFSVAETALKPEDGVCASALLLSGPWGQTLVFWSLDRPICEVGTSRPTLPVLSQSCDEI